MIYSIIAETEHKDAGQLWYLVGYSTETIQGPKVSSVIIGFNIDRRNQVFNVERLNAIAHEIKSRCEPLVVHSQDIQILSISYLGDGFRSSIEKNIA